MQAQLKSVPQAAICKLALKDWPLWLPGNKGATANLREAASADLMRPETGTRAHVERVQVFGAVPVAVVGSCRDSSLGQVRILLGLGSSVE